MSPTHLLSLSLLACGGVAAAAAPRPLPNAHAHNDYEHARPLADALDHGFNSVEADIYLVDGQLLVAHDREDCRPERTLRSLYLEPLRKRIEANGGSVHADTPGFTLLVDIKSDGKATYAALHEQLTEYRTMLTRVDNGRRAAGPVAVIVSGNRPITTMASQRLRYAGVDGRIEDLSGHASSHLAPLISDHWPSYFKWTGKGEFPVEERAKLARIADQAHRQGRRLRFWATPENEAVWRALRTAGVDLIGTDDLDRLQAFLTAYKPAQEKP